MRWVLTVALVLFLVACGSQDESDGLGPDADPASVPDITGSHFVAGVDPSGAAYGGRVLITQGTSDTYHLAWTVSGSLQQGDGRLSGNVLEVNWSSDRGTTGRATYTVTVEGGLRGVRTIDGYDGEGTEEIFAPREESS